VQYFRIVFLATIRRTTKEQAPNKSQGDVDQELNYGVAFVSAISSIYFLIQNDQNS
jgi:hypothetical protein